MSRVIAQKVTPADTGITELYRAPERTEAVIDQVVVANSDGSSQSFSVYHGGENVEADSITAADRIAKGTVDAADVDTALDANEGVKLEAGQAIFVESGSADVVTFTVFGKKAAEGFVFGSPVAS